MPVAIDLAGQRALVTGGTSGIGLGIARALAAAGASVAVTGTRDLGHYGDALDGLDPHRLDVAETGAVAQFLTAWQNRPLDILINAVGTVHYRHAEFQPNVFRSVMEVNLASLFDITVGFREALTASAGGRRSGSVVNITSLASFRATPNNPAYCASKAGLEMMTRSLAVAWGRYGIRVNAVAPGFVATKLTEVSRADPGLRAGIANRTPLRRWGTADDIAGCVCWLVSDAAGFVTGVTVPVDGGFSLAL